jgi:hypothetical protein
MRQKTLAAKRPEVAVQNLHALLRAEAHKSLPAALKRPFNETGQGILKPCPLQMVEKDLWHQLS